MNKNEIDENDLKIIKKIDIIRERIVKKSQKYLLINRVKKISLFFSLFIAALFIIIVSQNRKKHTAKPANYNIPIPDNKITLNASIKANRHVNINLTNNTSETSQKKEHILKTIVNEPKTIEPEQAEKTDILPESNLDITITECMPCQKVVSRKCINEQYIFSIKDNPKPFIWMTVKTNNLPQTVKHIYYHKGNIYCEVPLVIRYTRMRTWSYVTMKNPSHLGNWKVQVVNDRDQILKEIDFVMIP